MLIYELTINTMTNLRDLLSFNIKEQRQRLGISQATLAEKVKTSTHYIGMIESRKKFPSPEMMERIALALEIDAPELFSIKAFPVKKEGMVVQFQEKLINDISRLIYRNLREFDIVCPVVSKINEKEG